MKRIRRILCASDFSKTSSKALTSAINLAKASRARLLLLHANMPIVPVVPEQYVDANTWDRVEAETRRWAEHQLARLVGKARKAGVRVSAMVVTGDPARQIVRTARTTRADLIVMGTHGRRGVSKFFLGSVAERVIATASCPVMTVRGK
jgi:nucleotide-binding universal stress UspA family protein